MSALPFPCFERADVVEAYHERLRRDPGPVLELAARVREAHQARGIDLLDWSGWPLRPFFVDRARLDFIARGLHHQLDQLRRAMGRQAKDPVALAASLGLPPAFVSALQLTPALRSPELLSLLRPDGFLYGDRFVLSEINFGNGVLVSNAYTEVLHPQHAADPILAELGLAPDGLPRPFQAYLAMVRRRLRHPVRRRKVALLAHAWEWKVINGWEKRVRDQIDEAIRHMADAGLDAVVVHEDDLVVGADGWPYHKDEDLKFHAVLQITIGTSFMDEPERLAGDLAAFAAPRFGKAPFIKPLVSLCFDKGTMPWLQSAAAWPLAGPDGFRLEMADTHFPHLDDATRYRLDKDAYVLKRAYDGKDTHVGVSTPGRRWNRVLDQAVGSREYVIQKYHSLPETVVPVTPDGKSIEWVTVRVEVSPFVIEGRYAGAAVRYAPSAEGLVMSPPPVGMGFGTILPV